MDNLRFDIYLTGQLAPGLTTAMASERLAQLFRSTPAAMANLLTGKPQLLKRGVDEATAVKYREALQRAGLQVAVRQGAEAAVATPPTVQTAAPATGGLTLAPAGADVLTAAERAQPVVAAVDTSHISLVSGPIAATSAGRAVFGVSEEQSVGKPAAPIPPATPTASGPFTLAPAAGDLLRPEEKAAPPAVIPQVPALTLAEPGALLETLHDEAEMVVPDISALALAPAGGELLTAEEKPLPVPTATPDTSHLQLRDQA